MDINWYPGHMKKTFSEIENSLKLVDFAIVLLDGRAPWASLNPRIEEVLDKKPRIYLLNKADLSSPKESEAWVDFYNQRGYTMIPWDGRKTTDGKIIYEMGRNILREQLEREREKGFIERKLKAMILGIPNVGKSTIINQLSKRKGTKTGNTPGVTKTKQWIKVGEYFDLLDTPGVLWPKLDPPIRGRHLAYIGSIKDDIMDIETLAFEFIKEGKDFFPGELFGRYEIERSIEDPVEIMEEIGKKRGAIQKGAEVDFTKVANIILEDFRSGRMGQVTLETVNDYGKFTV